MLTHEYIIRGVPLSAQSEQKPMDIPYIPLTQNDLALLAIIVDGYLKSLLRPDIYPEHTAAHSWTLQQLKAKFLAIAKAKRDTPILLTELDVIALDEAVEGFIRICERGKPSPRGTSIPVEKLNEFRQQLAKMIQGRDTLK